MTLLGRRLRLHALVDFKTGHRKLDLNTYGRCTTNRRCRENFFPTEFDARRIASIPAGGSLVDFAIADASFAKLRELSATYTLPDRWAATLRASRASVSLAGRELHTWTRYGGLEPEATYLGGARGGNYGNIEQFMTPTAHASGRRGEPRVLTPMRTLAALVALLASVGCGSLDRVLAVEPLDRVPALPPRARRPTRKCSSTAPSPTSSAPSARMW